MQYLVAYQLKNADGTFAEEDGKPATAILGIKRALITDGKQLSAEQKVKRYELFTKLAALEDWQSVDLTIDEVAIAKDAIDIYPTLIYGQLVEFLNQKHG